MRRQLLPAMADERKTEIMLRVNLLLTSIMQEPSYDNINEFSREIAILTGAVACFVEVPLRERSDEHSRAIIGGIDALESVQARHNRIGKWGCNGDEIAALRRTVWAFDGITRWLPWLAYKAAEQHVDEQCKRL